MDAQGDRPELYPIALKLAGRCCLVVGGGAVAARKVLPLLDGGAEVTVVCKEASPAIEAMAVAGDIALVLRGFEPEDADGVFVAIAAADDPAVNEAVYRAAKKRGALVNVVDVPDLCDFYVPALVRRGDLTIAVSTSGACPALAKRLRRELELQFGPHYAGYVALLARLREATLASLNDPRERQAALEAFLESDALALLRDGRNPAAEALLQQHVDAIEKGEYMTTYAKQRGLGERAQEVLVGGVNSPVRTFSAVGGEPFYAESGRGAMLRSREGREFIDYVLSWGPLIIGHAHPTVAEAVCRAVRGGASFGVTSEKEVLLAERLIRHVPSIEKVRFVNSGTEAAMSAIRLARGATGRDLIVKCEGGYHGHSDGLLVAAGSGPATLGTPSSPGVPAAYAQCTLTVPFNDLEAAKEAFKVRGAEIAAFAVEPVAGNMGVVPPEPGYLEGLRALTREHGALLIFDEVMTGFRVAMGGAQKRYGVTPDVTVLGKVIGGGLPIGAYGGPAEWMDHLAPVGPVYQAGTLSGNPLAMAAGLATLDVLEEPGMVEGAEAALTALSAGLLEAAEEAGVPAYTTQAGAMGCLFFHDGPVRNFADAKACDTARYAAFFRGMLDAGVFFAPSQFEACFTSTLHDGQLIDRTLEAARRVFSTL